MGNKRRTHFKEIKKDNALSLTMLMCIVLYLIDWRNWTKTLKFLSSFISSFYSAGGDKPSQNL